MPTQTDLPQAAAEESTQVADAVLGPVQDFHLDIDFGDLNWLAILVATIVSFVLGGLWYGPLFGQAWMAAVGKTEEQIRAEGTAGRAMGISFLTQVVASTMLAIVFQLIGLEGWDDGAVLGALIGVGFIATSMASDYAFCNWGSRLWLIQSGYRIVYTALSGAILGQWL
ncbi:MAG: DUF1761 domain-containing protein [Planctomycetota bacterium]|jgi:hypothetical protein